jgi:hypothetical protein
VKYWLVKKRRGQVGLEPSSLGLPSDLSVAKSQWLLSKNDGGWNCGDDQLRYSPRCDGHCHEVINFLKRTNSLT